MSEYFLQIENLKFIDEYVDNINQIKFDKINENDILENLSIDNILSVRLKSKNMIFYKQDNNLFLLNDKFEKIQKLYPSEIDEIKNFGYNGLYFKESLYIFGFLKNNDIIIYEYKLKNKKFDLVEKFILNNLVGGFYPKIVNNSLVVVQKETENLMFYKFNLYQNEIEPEDSLKFNVKSENIILSITDDYFFVYDDVLYVIDINKNEVSEKLNLKPIFMESFKISNEYLTFISNNEKVVIFDKEVNIRQIIEEENISEILLDDSYIILLDSENNIVHIYALDQNGIYNKFGVVENIGDISKILSYNGKIILEIDGETRYLKLPKRLFDNINLFGYGFKSDTKEFKGNAIYLNNGKLSTLKKEDSLTIGFSKNISDIFFKRDETEINYQYSNTIDLDNILKDFILITEDFEKVDNILDNKKTNFVFIEYPNIELFFKAQKGSSIEISKYNKVINWEEDGVVKIQLFNNNFMIEILTKSDVSLLGYKILQKEQIINQTTYKIKSKESDVLVNDKVLSSYQTFFPYMDDSKVNGLVTNKIDKLDVEFKLNPIKINLPNFTFFKNIDINNLNQQFSRRYLIENNSKSVQVFDLLNNNKIIEYKLSNIDGIKKIIYVNPILIILSKPSNDIDTHIHLINSENSMIIPYVISNNNEENLTDLFTYHNDNLVFVTENQKNNIVYIVSFDSSNEVNNINKISLDEEVIKIKLFNNYLLVESINSELIIYDINTCQTLVSLSDENLISFDFIYNNLVILAFEEKLKLYIYEVKPDFELICEDEIDGLNDKSKVLIGPGRIIIYDNFNINIYSFDKFNKLIKISTLVEEFVHFYKNILVTKKLDLYNVYKFYPEVKYIDNHVNCNVKLDSILIKNNSKMDEDVTILLQINEKSSLRLNNVQLTNVCNEKCISKLDIKIKSSQEALLVSEDKNTSFCGLIVGNFVEKLPCFLKGTMVNTPNGIIPIEKLNNNEYIINDLGEKVKINLIKSWTTDNFNDGTIPYIIPKDSLKTDYPLKDTYISPYHRVKLPNDEFIRANQINLPFVKQMKNNGNFLSNKDFNIEKITYYNFILEKNSNFIANGMVVESLDKNNKLVNY